MVSRSGFFVLLFACLLCLVLDLTYPAKVGSPEIVSTGDGALFWRWNGAAEGGEADYGCQGGGEVDHFGCGGDESVCFIRSVAAGRSVVS